MPIDDGKVLNYKDYINPRPVVPQRLGLNANGIYTKMPILWKFLHLLLRTASSNTKYANFINTTKHTTDWRDNTRRQLG